MLKAVNRLFSATFPPEVLDASEEILNDPEQVFTGGTEIEVPEIDQKYIRVGRGNKLWALGRILLTMSDKIRYLSLPTQKDGRPTSREALETSF